MAAKEARKVGTKRAASEVGDGAGASAAATPFAAESATIVNATPRAFIFLPSISIITLSNKRW